MFTGAAHRFNLHWIGVLRGEDDAGVPSAMPASEILKFMLTTR
jgi:hypothetical protein